MIRTSKNRNEITLQLAEIFREHGFEGTTLAVITKATGIGKSSLYHFFPGGKEEMADAVLSHINAWFQDCVFGPLADADSPSEGIEKMLDHVDAYFKSGRRLCIVGVFATSETRDRFSTQVGQFFERWRDAIVATLGKTGLPDEEVAAFALEVLVSVQGGLVVARAVDDCTAFTKTIAKLRFSLAKLLTTHQ